MVQGRRVMSEVTLVTGFAGYGGRGRNPSAETAKALDGKTVGGLKVVGRILPVSHAKLQPLLQDLFEELRPRVAISIGLWPGEPTIRLERVGVNVADFEIPDNEGALLSDAPVSDNGTAAAMATLPLRAIEADLLAAGIPARLSATAGTFLCNATLYTILHLAQTLRPPALAGFVHVPYLPEQAAELLVATRRERKLELHQRADLASMDLGMMTHALEIAIAAAARALR
jgi:pyroglutamyl-peptidase